MSNLSSLYINAANGIDGTNGVNGTLKNVISNNNNGTLNGIAYAGQQKSGSKNYTMNGAVSNAATSAKPASTPTFDANTDYAALLQQAIKNKDTTSNVQTLLDQRNQKNNNLGLNQYLNDDISKQATDYINSRTDYSPDIDYSLLIQKAINNGSSVEEVQNLINQRNQKIIDSGNTQYLNDNYTQSANDYISYQGQLNKAIENYDKQAKADEDAIWAAVNQGTITLEQGKQAIEKTYQQAAKQAYLANQVSNKQANERLSSLGLGKTGYLPQVYGNISEAYGNALSSATNTKNQGSQDIDNSVSNLKAGAYTDIAKLKSDNAKSLADRVYEIQNNYKTQQNWREQFDQTNKNNQSQTELSQKQIAYENAWNLLNQGIYSDEIAKQLGISGDVAKRYADVAKQLLGV